MNIEDLKVKGFMVLEQAVNKELLDNLKIEFERLVVDKAYANNPMATSARAIKQPYRYCNYTVPLALEDIVVDIATSYFKEVCNVDSPGLGTCNLRRCFILPKGDKPGGTRLYHCDNNRPEPNFIKFFMYLNDVDIDGGPFTFVEGSHIDKPANCRDPYRKQDKEIEDMYPGKIHYLTANYGDLIVACTYGFHKGFAPRLRYRDMFTINWVDAPERDSVSDISQANYNKVPDEKKKYLRFLKVC